MNKSESSEEGPETALEEWVCLDCGHTTSAPVDELAGKQIEKTVGEGWRSKEIETVACPACESEDWHSESVATALLDYSETNSQLERIGHSSDTQGNL